MRTVTSRPHDATAASPVTDAPVPTPERTIDRRRLGGRSTRVAVGIAAVAAVGQALGTIVIGRLADAPTTAGVALLAVLVVGAAVLDTVARVVWSAVVDRAEGRLRSDLLATVMHQPLSALSEQAVGETLDRIDDDTHEIGTLLRDSAWRVVRLLLVGVPLLLVAGFTWWPAFVLFPLTAGAVFVAVRPAMGRIGELRVIEEAAWTDHAAATEEGIAARDDLRTSLGQAYLVRRVAELAADVHEKFRRVVVLEAVVIRRSGLLLHGLLAIVAVGGVLVVVAGGQSTSTLVTLFAVTVTFVGQIDRVAHQLPDLQAGLGALVRLRALIESETEPTGGATLPDGPLDVEFRDLTFSYPEGDFALRDVDLTIADGTTCALVGRSGSGKSTLSSLLSRAVDPPPGTVFVGGVDVLDLDLDALRSAVGSVTQRTEIIAGTLAENVALFGDTPRSRIEQAIDELGLADWVAGLPDGLDTLLGPAGTVLSSGEEQLVAFARLLVRDVGVIVLDEATARMDPMTEERVVAASSRLLEGRTGIVVAHRMRTTERAESVAVMDAGRIVEQGGREELARRDGRFRRLLDDAEDTVAHATSTAGTVTAGNVPALATTGSASVPATGPATGEPSTGPGGGGDGAGPLADTSLGGTRRVGTAPPPRRLADVPRLAAATWSAVRVHPEWSIVSIVLFLFSALLGAYGAVSGWIWGNLVADLEAGDTSLIPLWFLVGGLVAAPLFLAEAVRRYPRWWIDIMLRVRTSVLIGQTAQRRLDPTPPGEVVARAMDSDRFARYTDRWVDVANGIVIAAVASFLGGTVLAGAVLLAVMTSSAAISALGSPAAGRSAAAASTARAGFGRSLVSALDSIRTVKLAAATRDVHRHLRSVDGARVGAAVREHRVQSVLDGLPVVLVQLGVVAAWAIHVAGGWGLATALLVSGAVSGFDWFGRVAGAVITEAPGTRAWHVETSRLAGGGDLMDIGEGLDLVSGTAPGPPPPVTDRFERLVVDDLSVVHDDGTIGVHGVDLVVDRGELVLLLGRVGSGKSSLLRSLAGLAHHTGTVRWNGSVVGDAETFLRPGRVAYVGQVPRVLSGSFHDNVRMDHDRGVDRPLDLARLGPDVADAGGPDAAIGHRGVRLSGGQVQRLALARALAADAEVLVADDISSALDATTEIELWEALRASGRTVIGSTNKRAALARADRVVVVEDGTVVAEGPWSQLAPTFGHVAG